MKYLKKPKPIEVKWTDHYGVGDTGWEAMEFSDNISGTVLCYTRGYLVAEDEEAIYVAGSISPDKDDKHGYRRSNTTCILKANIVKKRWGAKVTWF